MIHGELNDATLSDYPPGHPAGTDEFVSAGAVLSGRGMGTGGVLGTRARVTGVTTHRDHAPAAPSQSGPTVLIAVDGASMSERIVRTAHRLFGEHATYLAINVGSGPYTKMSWAYVLPVGGPSTWSASEWVDDAIAEAADTGQSGAETEASEVTHAAGLSQATPLGDIGDPTSAIIRAAHHHGADVVVIGADVRSWLSHVTSGSVERDLLREADFAVLVVDAGGSVAQR